MAKKDKQKLQAPRAPTHSRIPPARLDALIEEAIVDAYNEAEQAVGFHAMIEQHLAVPFETVVLGTAAIVKKIDVTARGHVVAICYRGHERQAIPILELPRPNPPPIGWEWIEAYRRWSKWLVGGLALMSAYQYYEFRAIDRPLTDIGRCANSGPSPHEQRFPARRSATTTSTAT